MPLHIDIEKLLKGLFKMSAIYGLAKQPPLSLFEDEKLRQEKLMDIAERSISLLAAALNQGTHFPSHGKIKCRSLLHVVHGNGFDAPALPGSPMSI